MPGLGQASSRASQENRAPDFWVSFSGGIAERLPTLSQAGEHVPGPSGRPPHRSDGRDLLKRTGNDPPLPTDMVLHPCVRVDFAHFVSAGAAIPRLDSN